MFKELWDQIKNQIGTINGGKPIKCKKDYLQVEYYVKPLGKVFLV